MKSTMTLPLIMTLACLACSPGTSEQEAASAQPGGDGWLTEAMASPAFLTACEETPGCTPPGDTGAQDTEIIWRLAVTRASDGVMSIGRPDRVEVIAGTGIPMSPPGAELALVGLDASDKIVAGSGLRFATQLRIEFEGGGETKTISLEDQAVDTVGYLPALSGLTRVEVRDSSGQILATLDLPTASATGFGRNPLRWLGIEAAYAVTRPFQDLPPYCAHIIVLQGEFERELGEGMEFSSANRPTLRLREWLGADDTIRLVRPGPYQMAATRAALARLTPLLCQSVSRIAFGVVPESQVPGSVSGAVASASAGDLIVVNVASSISEIFLTRMISRRLMMQSTITHEAGHTAETLLTFESSNPSNYQGAWTAAAHELASETIDNVRLEVGLPTEWLRLHKSFQQQGWAAAYDSFPFGTAENPAPWRSDDLLKGGFISQYSSTNWAEDITDHVKWPYMSKPVRTAYAENNVSDDLREDAACMVMREYSKPNLPAEYAAVYTKLHFLQDLGLVWPEDVGDCTGESVGLHIESRGFHIWQNDALKRSFANGLAAHLGTTPAGAKVFNLEAAGEAGFGQKTFPAQIKLKLGLGKSFDNLDRVSWPRGVYPLGLTGNNNFQLRLDGAPAGNFDAMDGFVLVAESSGKRIAGSVVLQRVMRLQAPIPVPERYDPPLVVRFMIDKN